MTYQIAGLNPVPFEPWFAMSDEELNERGARRVVATSPRGFPCRVSLTDAAVGTELILLNHVSHDVDTPFRTSYAIYVAAGAEQAQFADALPPVFEGRTLGLRAFDSEGMLRAASLAMPGESDTKVRELLDNPDIATIHAHNAAHGCFIARIERN